MDLLLEHIHSGELIAILGAPGSGKSTLLAYLGSSYQNHIIQQSRLRGDLTWSAASRRGRSVAIDIWERMTDSTSLVSYIRRGSQRNRSFGRIAKLRALHCLQTVGLGNIANNLIGSLTFYEKRVLALARALSAEPELILADDFITGLPMDDASKLCGLAGSICKSHGVACIFSTHRFTIAHSCASRIVLLEGGAIALCAPPDIVDRSAFNACISPSRAIP
ncbi:MAG TPA: ATP-binding cassette domain-containing protein [Dissulfurispiraceae bacterium]|nr:ATP-binding cassette domain-containing protein [Dissulfurispiraceae bacterium]